MIASRVLQVRAHEQRQGLMQEVQLLVDEPGPLAEHRAGTSEPASSRQAAADLPTTRGQAALDTADRYAGKAHAHATRRAYRSDWMHFGDWCQAHGFIAMPAEPRTVGAYLASLGETFAPNTIRRRLSAIGKAHRYNNLDWNPGHRDIQEPLRGALREHGRPPRQAAALTLELLQRLLETCDLSPAGRRDRAMLLIGFAAALRRSELVGLKVGDITASHDGLQIRLGRSKTDQEGRGATIGLPHGEHHRTCPVRAFQAWQQVARRSAGPLFRPIRKGGHIGTAALTPSAVTRIVLRRAALAGVVLEGPEQLSAHALRVGFITEAYARGVRDEDIMRHTRHRDLRTMRGYVRRAGLISDSPARRLGL